MNLQINACRLQERLEKLAQIGRLSQGGVRRLAYSPEDLAARCQVKQWMQAAGLITDQDAAGNLIGIYPGLQPTAAALATGSHLDTVPTGGRYDGVLGVLAGIEIAQTLKDQKQAFQHPFQVIVFTDEEGSMIGSKAMAGQVNPDPEQYRQKDGRSIQDCLLQVGGNWDQIATAQRSRRDLIGFVELHVEQGCVLEHFNKCIGIVEGIVGTHRLQITVVGRSAHAGTTPMTLRQDALVAAAQMIMIVHDLACQLPGDQVATVGSLQVWPNAVNVVPGQVTFTVDVRSLWPETVASFLDQFNQDLQAIAVKTHTKVEMTPLLKTEPTLASNLIQEIIRGVCEDRSLSYLHLPSRAGHDAQEMGRFTDIGMIFIPSYQGISHSEAEYTTPEQCAAGATVLLETLIQLDQKYPITDSGRDP